MSQSLLGITISGLPEADTLTGAEQIEVVQGGLSRRALLAGVIGRSRELAAADLRTALEAAGVLRPPACAWAGALTPSGFRVNFDLYAEQTSVGIVVSPQGAPGTIAHSSADITPEMTVGTTGDLRYYTARFTVTGLSPNTFYEVRRRIAGVVETTPILTVRTAPAAGAAAGFRFAFGSCSDYVPGAGPVFEAIAADAPLFLVHAGDIEYPDPSVDGPGVHRDGTARAFRRLPGVQTMLRTVPIAYTWDDHDSGPNDNHWDQQLPSRVPVPTIQRWGRQVVRETVPIYPTVQDGLGWSNADTNILAQQWTIGRARFLMPDLRSQRRRSHTVNGVTVTVANPTYLGGNTGHEYWNQKTWLLSAISEAAADGIKLLFLVSATTWYPAIFDSYLRHAPAEVAELCDAIAAADVQIVLLVGDAHQCGADDGTNTDYSTSGNARFPMLLSSGLMTPIPFDDVTPMSWNGADGNATGTGNQTAYAVIDVIDNGGDDVRWTCAFKGAPFTGGVPATLKTVASTDRTPTIGFAGGATSLRLPVGEALSVELRKDWFGPSGGCSVAWAAGAGQSGAATWKPNAERVTLSIPYAGTNSFNLQLSAPQRCAIAGSGALAVNYITYDADALALRAAMTVQPSSSRLDAIATMIEGLKADGVWSKLHALYVLAAHHEQASRLNWRAPGGTALTALGTASFVTDRGWRGDPTGGTSPIARLDTGIIPNAVGGVFTQNNVAMGVWVLERAANSVGEFGSTNLFVCPEGSAGDGRFRSSTATTSSITPANTIGHFAHSRSASTGFRAYVNGSPWQDVTQASTGLTADEMWICGLNISGGQTTGARRVALAHIGPALTNAEMAALHARSLTYLQSVGAA